MAALSCPLSLGGNGAVPRLGLFHRKSMHLFLRIWAALSVNQSVKKWGILLICFLNIVQRAMHICSFHSVYVACTCIWSASPPPACTQTRLPHHPPWTVIVNHLILDKQVIPSRHQNHPPKASPICLGCVLTPVSGVLLLPIEINHDDELVWKLKKSIKASTCWTRPSNPRQASFCRRRPRWWRPWGEPRGSPSWRSTSRYHSPNRDIHSHPWRLSSKMVP